jgi:hypothetical protein
MEAVVGRLALAAPPLGHIVLNCLAQGCLIVGAQRLVPLGRRVGRDVPQGQLLIGLEAQGGSQPALTLAVAERLVG